MVVAKKPDYFTIQLGDKVDNVSLERLKPACLPEGAVAADPPRHGQPRHRPA